MREQSALGESGERLAGGTGGSGRRRAGGVRCLLGRASAFARLERVGPRGLAGPSGMRGELGGSRGRPGWGAGRREREKGGKGLGCLSGFRARSGWLVGFGFSIFFSFLILVPNQLNQN